MTEATSSSMDDTKKDTKKGVVVIRGDIWAAPSNSVLIHACNCQGVWGSGIAAQFKEDYPNAYAIYHKHCATNTSTALLGTTLIIPAQQNDRRKHYIACLFTSANYGKRVDPSIKIERHTKLALQDLAVQYEELKLRNEPVGGLHSCKINSVRFGVAWSVTLKVMEEELGNIEGGVVVYEFEGEDPAVDKSSGSKNNSGQKSNLEESARSVTGGGVTSKVDDQSQTQSCDEAFQQLGTSPRSSSSSSSSNASIDVNNLPYTSPPVLPIRKSPHQFRTIVRDGPVETPEGAEERYVIIAKRSFRGAGPWRVRGDIVLESGKRMPSRKDEDEEDNKMNDTVNDIHRLDEEDEDGEVEIMWDIDGFRYQLMRGPPGENGEIKKETHWVNTHYFEK